MIISYYYIDKQSTTFVKIFWFQNDSPLHKPRIRNRKTSSIHYRARQRARQHIDVPGFLHDSFPTNHIRDIHLGLPWKTHLHIPNPEEGSWHGKLVRRKRANRFAPPIICPRILPRIFGSPLFRVCLCLPNRLSPAYPKPKNLPCLR